MGRIDTITKGGDNVGDLGKKLKGERELLQSLLPSKITISLDKEKQILVSILPQLNVIIQHFLHPQKKKKSNYSFLGSNQQLKLIKRIQNLDKRNY